MPREPIHRTTYEVEVFSEGPFIPASGVTGGDDDPFDLAYINYAITEGHCIGNVTATGEEIVPADKLREELLRIGNDGEFFDDPFGDDEDD